MSDCVGHVRTCLQFLFFFHAFTPHILSVSVVRAYLASVGGGGGVCGGVEVVGVMRRVLHVCVCSCVLRAFLFVAFRSFVSIVAWDAAAACVSSLFVFSSIILCSFQAALFPSSISSSSSSSSCLLCYMGCECLCVLCVCVFLDEWGWWWLVVLWLWVIFLDCNGFFSFLFFFAFRFSDYP